MTVDLAPALDNDKLLSAGAQSLPRRSATITRQSTWDVYPGDSRLAPMNGLIC